LEPPNPRYVVAFRNRGIAWSEKGDIDRALADFSEAIRLDPKAAASYYARGDAWSAAKPGMPRATGNARRPTSTRPSGSALFDNPPPGWFLNCRLRGLPQTRR
jgi:tetratricopeptide (TPR) repeat protein